MLEILWRWAKILATQRGCYRLDMAPKAHLDNGTFSMLPRRLYGRMRPLVSDKTRKLNIMQNAVGNCTGKQLQNANDIRQQAYETANMTQLDWITQQVMC